MIATNIPTVFVLKKDANNHQLIVMAIQMKHVKLKLKYQIKSNLINSKLTVLQTKNVL